MPRSIDEILEHADELAARFEDYEPRASDEQDSAAVVRLRDAVAERSEAERHMLEAIKGRATSRPVLGRDRRLGGDVR